MKRMRFFLINGERKSPADKSCPRVQCSGFSFARGFESPFEAWLRARSASYQRIGMTVYPSSFFLCDICPIKSTKKVLKKCSLFYFIQHIETVSKKDGLTWGPEMPPDMTEKQFRDDITRMDTFSHIEESFVIWHLVLPIRTQKKYIKPKFKQKKQQKRM